MVELCYGKKRQWNWTYKPALQNTSLSFVFIPFRLKGCSGYTQKTFACRVSYPFINLSKQIMCKSSRYQCNLIMHSFLNICFESGVTSSIVLITGPIYFWQQTEEDVNRECAVTRRHHQRRHPIQAHRGLPTCWSRGSCTTAGWATVCSCRSWGQHLDH